MEGLFTEIVGGDAEEKSISVNWSNPDWSVKIGEKVLLIKSADYIQNMELRKKISSLEIQLNQARGALGYPVPGDTPESDLKCGLCANKEKDYQKSKIEQQTLWKAFQLLAESTR